MSFYNPDAPAHQSSPFNSQIINELKKNKRFLIAVFMHMAICDKEAHGQLTTPTLDQDTNITFDKNLAIDLIAKAIEYDTHQIKTKKEIEKIKISVSAENSWAIASKWYFELIETTWHDKFYSYKISRHTFKSRETTKRPWSDHIFHAIGISIQEKIDCLIDLLCLMPDTSREEVKSITLAEYAKVEKLINWTETPAEHESQKINHIANSLKRTFQEFQISIAEPQNHIKNIIVEHRNSPKFCDAILAAAKKGWNQQQRRESGKTKQLGLSLKTETIKKLKSIAKENLISETQALEVIINLEYTRKIYMKALNSKAAAIEQISNSANEKLNEES
ncbi:hypothetical protein [Vogesella sp. AC12]|uniref:hypothetical protein n=1 Tax=Vogesella sp. AC12 TaxID=2950550 RepID=UPI00210AB379|nr:hypothetical protein [Vogesella sp. AC12]MCQ4143343.1 hypothetical protein [Vogesella sp. AC12]